MLGRRCAVEVADVGAGLVLVRKAGPDDGLAPPPTRVPGHAAGWMRWRSRLMAASFGSAAPTPPDIAAGPARSGAGGLSLLQAPLPGRVVRIAVAVGDAVARAPAAGRGRSDEDRDGGRRAPRWGRRGGALRGRGGRRRWSSPGRVSPTMTAPQHHPRPDFARWEADDALDALHRAGLDIHHVEQARWPASAPQPRTHRQAFTFRSADAVDPHLLLVFDSPEALEAWRLWLARYWKARPYLSIHDNIILLVSRDLSESSRRAVPRGDGRARQACPPPRASGRRGRRRRLELRRAAGRLSLGVRPRCRSDASCPVRHACCGRFTISASRRPATSGRRRRWRSAGCSSAARRSSTPAGRCRRSIGSAPPDLLDALNVSREDLLPGRGAASADAARDVRADARTASALETTWLGLADRHLAIRAEIVERRRDEEQLKRELRALGGATVPLPEHDELPMTDGDRPRKSRGMYEHLFAGAATESSSI